MKPLADATQEDIKSVLAAIGQGESPTHAVQTLFDVTDQDAEIMARMWVTALKEETLLTPGLLEAVMSKDGAMKRLAVLALYAEQEETQRKALMDIAKLQQWVNDNPNINLGILTGSMQEVEAFLKQHDARAQQILPPSLREPLPEKS